MKESVIVLLCLLVVTMTGGCKILKGLVRSPSIQLDSVALKSTSLFQGDLEFTFNMTNPNPIGVSVDSMTYQLGIDGRKTMEGTLNQGLALPAMVSKSVTIPITVNYMESVDSLLDFFKKDSLSYELSGTFKIGAFTVPFSHKDVITLPKPPSVQVKGVSIRSMTFTGARLALELEITRQTPGRIDLKKITYAISLGGFKLFNGKSENFSMAEDTKTQTITVPLTVDFITLGKSAMTLFSQGNIDYELSGDMEFDIPKVGIRNFPFKKAGNTGMMPLN